MSYHPPILVLGKRDVIGAWLVYVIVAAACLGSSMVRAADHRASAGLIKLDRTRL